MILIATTLPEHSNDGYVAAAYIVFFAIVLIYVAIMAVRLGRVERKIEGLRGDAEKSDMPPARAGAIADLDEPNPKPERPDRGQEHAMDGPRGGGHPEGHRQAGETV
ncbi:MAG: hypothetical protein WAU42_06265 [Solirubrobacteraceae bacterium]